MSSSFKNILIPVDFSANTDIAIKQAVELACANGSTFHLLHVVKPQMRLGKILFSSRVWFAQNEKKNVKKAVNELQQWKHEIEGSYSHCKVKTYIKEGSVCDRIQDVAKEIKPQLIIIAKSRDHKYISLFNSICPNGLAKSTGYPVLTIRRKIIDAEIKIIVVPVSSFIPTRKIEFAIEFAKRYRVVIHLVTIPEKIGSGNKNGSAFLETYRILSTGLTSPVEHHILKGNNFPKAILEYAECIRADLMLVSPGTETKISNFLSRHINDVLTSSAKLKVLSIEPYHGNELSVC